MTLDSEFISRRLDATAQAVRDLASQTDQLQAILGAVRGCFDAGGRLYACGNGGSAAEAMHLTEELIGKFRDPRRPYPAVCLNADPTALTCIANDFCYDAVFARQIEALGASGDVLVGFSTSGASPNVRLAFEQARASGVTTIGLLGRDGGACLDHCDHALVVRHDATEIIQECHQVILHLILEAVERP